VIIGVLNLTLIIPSSNSLKDKRQVVKSIKDRLRNKFNISVAEVGEKEKWQAAHLAVVIVNDDKKYLETVLNEVIHFVEGERNVYVEDIATEIL